MPLNWPMFSPYMRFGRNFVTQIDQKWSHYFPLYAFWPGFCDTNWPKTHPHFDPLIFPYMHFDPKNMTKVDQKWPRYFPLYAFWTGKVDQNRWKWSHKNVPCFSLICILIPKSLPELPKIDEIFIIMKLHNLWNRE